MGVRAVSLEVLREPCNRGMDNIKGGLLRLIRKMVILVLKTMFRSAMAGLLTLTNFHRWTTPPPA